MPEDIDPAEDGRLDLDPEDDGGALYFSGVAVILDNGVRKLRFARAPRAQPLSESAAILYSQIEGTAQTIRELVRDDRIAAALFQHLAGIGYQGLVGPNPDTSSQLNELQRFRVEQVEPHLRKARRIYAAMSVLTLVVTSTLAMAGLYALLSYEAAILTAAEARFAPTGAPQPASVLSGVDFRALLSGTAAFLFGVIGFAVAEVVTAFYAAQRASLESYRTNNRFRFWPVERLAFGLALLFLTLVFVAVDWIILGVAGTELKDAVDGKPLLGVIVGIVIGLAFDRIAGLLVTKAKDSVADTA